MAEIKTLDRPMLKIVVGDKHVATLYHDSQYCLTYKPAFLEVGLAPFNIEDFNHPSEKPKIDFVYRRDSLWHIFAERLPDPSRADFEEIYRRYEISDKTDPLVILGKIGSISISKPWRLELVKGGDAGYL